MSGPGSSLRQLLHTARREDPGRTEKDGFHAMSPSDTKPEAVNKVK